MKLDIDRVQPPISGSFIPSLAIVVGNRGQFRADAPDQDRLRAADLGPQELGGHVLVADVELLDRNNLELVALYLDLVQQVVPPRHAVVRGVVQDRYFREFPVDRLFYHHSRLDAVMRGEPEDRQVLHTRLAPLRHGR